MAGGGFPRGKWHRLPSRRARRPLPRNVGFLDLRWAGFHSCCRHPKHERFSSHPPALDMWSSGGHPQTPGSGGPLHSLTNTDLAIGVRTETLERRGAGNSTRKMAL